MATRSLFLALGASPFYPQFNEAKGQKGQLKEMLYEAVNDPAKNAKGAGSALFPR
jgi:hypothetical protein